MERDRGIFGSVPEDERVPAHDPAWMASALANTFGEDHPDVQRARESSEQFEEYVENSKQPDIPPEYARASGASLEELSAEFGADDNENNLGEHTGGDAPERAVAPRVRANPQEISRAFGDWGRASCHAGIVDMPAPTNLGDVTAVQCHHKIAEVFTAFLDEVYEKGLWHLIQSVEGYQVAKRQFVPRRLGERTIALSSWGLSLTINRAYNPDMRLARNKPFGEPEDATNAGHPGYAFFIGHPIVDIAARHGLTWAGAPQWPTGAENPYPQPSVFAWVDEW